MIHKGFLLISILLAVGILAAWAVSWLGVSYTRCDGYQKFELMAGCFACDDYRFMDSMAYVDGDPKFEESMRWKWTFGKCSDRDTTWLPSIKWSNLASHPTVVLPLWIPFIAFAVYPAVSFVRGPLRRSVRRKRNQCTHCGYDLAGNVSGICPECGGAK